jgi:hypothetical protein
VVFFLDGTRWANSPPFSSIRVQFLQYILIHIQNLTCLCVKFVLRAQRHSLRFATLTMAVQRRFRPEALPAASQTTVSFYLKVRIDMIYLKMRLDLAAKKKTECYGLTLQIMLGGKILRTQITDKPARDRICPASVRCRYMFWRRYHCSGR